MKCPTIEEVLINRNNQYRLAIWWRFVTWDDSDPKTFEEAFKLIDEFFNGFTPELSKQIGWDERKYDA